MYNLLTRNSAIFKKLFRTNQRCFITNATMNKIDEKLKGTIFENWLRFWKNVHHDYREMIKEAHNDIMEKPVKAFLYFLGCTFVGCCASFNPNEANFRSKYIECANKLLLVSPVCQKPEAVVHLKYIENFYNTDLLRRTNLGIASVIWVDNSCGYCKNYESQCSYLGVRFADFIENQPYRILDIGFLNIWWILSKKMLDYDINF